MEENVSKESLLAVMEERKRLETELSDWLSVLDGQGVGMDEALVDPEDFPRNDIDVMKVRQARNKIIRLRNDLSHLMTKLELGLHSVHRQVRETAGIVDPDHVEVLLDQQPQQPPRPSSPFALIDQVDLQSPAGIAGLQVGDAIVEFGSVDADNFDDLKSVSNVVENSVNQNVRVKVIRCEKLITILLKPRPWSGRGLLGCKIVPVRNVSARRLAEQPNR